MSIIAELQKTDGTKFSIMQIFNYLKGLFLICGLVCLISCEMPQAQTINQPQTLTTPEKTPPPIIADKFAYLVGKTGSLTQSKDKKDNWYNAQDFTVNTHLGED